MQVWAFIYGWRRSCKECLRAGKTPGNLYDIFTSNHLKAFFECTEICLLLCPKSMHVETEGWGLRKWSLGVCLRRVSLRWKSLGVISHLDAFEKNAWRFAEDGVPTCLDRKVQSRVAIFMFSLLFFCPNWLWSKRRNTVVSFASHALVHRVHDTHTHRDTSTCSRNKICIHMQMQSQYILVLYTLTPWRTYRHI